MNLQCIIFDFDGVLVDSEPVHFKALLKTVKPLGIDFNYTTYLERYLGFDDADALQIIFKDFSLRKPNDAWVRSLVREKALVLESLLPELKAPAGLKEFLETVPLEIRFAISSGALGSDIKKILPLLFDQATLDRFLFVVSADDVTHSKPDPEPYVQALKLLKCEPTHALSFEDSPKGIESSKGAGLKTVGMVGTVTEEVLRPLTDLVLQGWSGLTYTKLLAMI